MAVQQKAFKQEMIEAAIKVAATQTAIEGTADIMIAMGVIPIVGWVSAAIGVVITVISHFNNARVQRGIAEVMNQLKKDISARQASVQNVVHAAESDLSDKLLPAAQTLALSNTPLEGLGDFWSDIGKKLTKVTRPIVKHVTKPIAKAIVQVYTVPAKVVGDATMKAVASAARSTGHENLASKIDNTRKTMDKKMKMFQDKYTGAMGDPAELASDLKTAVGMVTGDEEIAQAQQGADRIRTKAYAQLAAAQANALATLGTPEYQQNLTISLARAIRNDPSLLSEAQAVQQQEQAFASQSGLAPSTVVATVPASNAGALVTIGAALSAFFLLRH